MIPAFMGISSGKERKKGCKNVDGKRGEIVVFCGE
jgi:hypothetical protein